MYNENNFSYKLDVFNFDYTDNDGKLASYIAGKSISDNKERFVANISVNPNKEDELQALSDYLNLPCSLDGRTIGININLLNDSVIDILKDAYNNKKVLGIRILPDDSVLDSNLFNKLNVDEFAGMLVAVDNISGDIDINNTKLDLRVQNGIYKIEHINYLKKGPEEVDHYNVHINHELDDIDIKELVSMLKRKAVDQIILDYYKPTYYREFLNMLKNNDCPSIKVRLMGNPLYDEESCFKDLESILENKIDVSYSTCVELNSFYSKEPFTEGVNYYSDIEPSGLTDIDNYYATIKMIDEVVEYMDEKEFSPLEKVVYLEDYFKENFVYDPNYLEANHYDMNSLDKLYRKDGVVCEGFSKMYSAILRKSGILCYTYGTDIHQKNIIRIKDDKYGVDNLALIDTETDLDNSKGNEFNSFLVPIDNDIYAQDAEVISVPTSLIISSDEYDNNINKSNSIYSSNPLGNAVRMLQLMGLGYGDRVFSDAREETEFYKSALANSSIIEEISYDKIAKAVSNVRASEGKYRNIEEQNEEFINNSRFLQTRGNDYYVAPAIKILGPPDEVKDVELFKVFTSDEYDKHFVEMPDQNEKYQRPRRRNKNESTDEYTSYLDEFYDKTFHWNEKNIKDKEKRDMREYVTDNVKLEEVVLYRDTNDSGRVYAAAEVFERFGYDLPKNAIKFENEKLYEMRVSDLVQLLNDANNNTRPYLVQYKFISAKNKNSQFDNHAFVKKASSPSKLYIKKEFADKLGRFNGEVVMVGGIPCYEVNDDQVQFVNDKKDSKIKSTFKSESKVKNTFRRKLIIYRDVDRPEDLYLRKDLYERFNLKADVEEVLISGIPCCVLDRGDLQYIIGHANNSLNPYEIEYRDVEINVMNMRPLYNDSPVDVVKIYRNTDQQNRLYISKEVFDRFHFNTDVEEVIVSGVHLYVIDDNDLAYIISNASNKYNPYQVAIIDSKMESKNMRPAHNDVATESVTLYRNDRDEDTFFMTMNDYHKFNLKTPVEEIIVNGIPFYLIDSDDIEYIVRNANNRTNPYRLEYKDLPKREENAKDLVDSEFIPGTTFKKPKARGEFETDQEYVAYLESFYKGLFGLGSQFKK